MLLAVLVGCPVRRRVGLSGHMPCPVGTATTVEGHAHSGSCTGSLKVPGKVESKVMHACHAHMCVRAHAQAGSPGVDLVLGLLLSARSLSAAIAHDGTTGHGYRCPPIWTGAGPPGLVRRRPLGSTRLPCMDTAVSGAPCIAAILV